MLAAIGPCWDGNEVWLVASGGVLVFAFPRAYAAAFSGFYLPLMMVLWLLVLRGLSIELPRAMGQPAVARLSGRDRSPFPRRCWRSCSASRSATSCAACRSAPRALHAALFGEGGALDAYTVLVGLFAVAALGAHGAAYLAWKCEGDVYARSRHALARALSNTTSRRSR